ncbi:SET domain-containing protein-lysine N-methyltransferase [Mesorhizobium captivum]|uniref:SET domain-containing protein-lysine N-methyltransferase n=1 Tax=Mesorhizobium captivum TaxID=3072319 RepID=UPI003D31C6C1
MRSNKTPNRTADLVVDCRKALYVKNVPRKGRGLFANIIFNVGDVIECAPTWGFDELEASLLDRTGLFQYYFVRRERQHKGDHLIGYVVFGLVSIANHSAKPNAQIIWHDEDCGAWVSLVAIEDINIDEEITHCYTNISSYPNNIAFV